jgi:hypothetical protein
MSRKSIEERVDELEDGKQNTLVSGTTIKTINGASILGSGNLTVTGSGAAWGGITGTLSSQTDLQTVLNGKASGTGTANGTNTGDQTSIVGITGTKAQFDTSVTDGNFVFVGDAVLNPEGWNVIVKSANQDVIGSTLVDDSELQFSVVAGGSYLLELIIATSGSSSTDDYKFGFLVSTGTMAGQGNALSRNTALAVTNTALSSIGTATTASIPVGSFGGVIPTSSGVQSATAFFSFTASANATFKMQFACNTGTLSTARTWKGSILKYKRLD